MSETFVVPEFKTQKSEQTYHRVLSTAVTLFARDGFEKTTMRTISKEARLGLGALYYYFPSKEAIVIAFYEQLNHKVAAEFRAKREPEASMDEQLKLLLELKLKALEPHRTLARVLIKEAVDPDSPLTPLARDSDEAMEISLSLFREIAGDAGPAVARMLWLGHLAVIGLWVHRPDRAKVATQTFSELAPLLALALQSGALGSAGDLLNDLIAPE